jgi:hypothetical protein
MKKEVAGEWRILHSVDLKYLHSSPNTVTVIKAKKINMQF